MVETAVPQQATILPLREGGNALLMRLIVEYANGSPIGTVGRKELSQQNQQDPLAPQQPAGGA